MKARERRGTAAMVLATAATLLVCRVTAAEAVPATNDACANATAIAVLPYTDSVDTTATTTDAADPTPGCGGGSRAKSVWYSFTASSNSLLTADTDGSDYDTVLSVYTGSCGALTPVPGGCDDDGGTTPASSVTFFAPAGATYYFLVTAFSGDGGNLTFHLTGTTAAVVFAVNSTADAVDASPGNGVCADADGNCTLRAAVQESNALADLNIITVPAGTYTLTIAGAGENGTKTGDLDITDDLAIVGAGSATTIVDANQVDRAFDVRKSIPVFLYGLTIRNGKVSGPGGGINNSNGNLTLTDCVVSQNTTTGSSSDGGGIYSTGLLTLKTSSVLDNTATGDGGGIASTGSFDLHDCTISGNQTTGTNADGGGINAIGLTVSTITGSTIGGRPDGDLHGNLAKRHGGGIHVGANEIVTVLNSTISGNMANVDGGGVYANHSAGATAFVSLNDVTIAGNTADADGNGSGDGGGVRATIASAVRMEETILAENFDTGGEAPDCASVGEGISSAGYNLVGQSDGCNWVQAVGDQVGSIAAPVNPLLGPLQDNGGPTLTHALGAGSPAFNGGEPTGCFFFDPTGRQSQLRKDQRSKLRLAPCDIGAYEVQPPSGSTPTSTPTPTATVELPSPTATPTKTASPSPTQTVLTATPTATATGLAAASPTATPTVVSPASPTNTPAATPTNTTTEIATATLTPAATATTGATGSPTSAPTLTSTSAPTDTPTAPHTATETPSVDTPTLTPTQTSTVTPTDTPTCAPTGTPYCSNQCPPTPTIAPGCVAPGGGLCIQNPECAANEACVPDSSGSISGCCTCATLTPTPTDTSTPTTTPVPSDTPTSTATDTPTDTPTVPVSPTPSIVACAGDCNGSGSVTIDEVLLMVNIALDTVDVSQCDAGDLNHDGVISVDEILTAVNVALQGCL